MTDAMAGGDRAAMEQRIVQRSLEDDAFRRRLLEDPKAAVEQELGTRLPEEVRVVSVEETADTVYLVIPPPRRPAGKAVSSPTGNSRRWPAEAGITPGRDFLPKANVGAKHAYLIRLSMRPSALLPERGYGETLLLAP